MVKDYKEIKKIGEGGFGEVFLIQKKKEKLNLVWII